VIWLVVWPSTPLISRRGTAAACRCGRHLDPLVHAGGDAHQVARIIPLVPEPRLHLEPVHAKAATRFTRPVHGLATPPGSSPWPSRGAAIGP
jgi:hypothetical protein